MSVRPTRVAILPSDVADQIAAGEVVERPASVIKELVENALDAGATAVEIDIADGGRQSMRVSDDGCGMERADATLALARHATSKIRDAADLVGVRSFGFRGEALPAIASVSRLVIETASADGAGTRVEVGAGSAPQVTDIARQRGTTVEVSELFHNAPARQRFLRGGRSEARAITEAMTAIALTRRDVRFRLVHDGKAAQTLPAAAHLRERVGGLFGAGFAERLLDVDSVQGSTHVCGLVERPGDVGVASRRVHLSLNGRAIRDHGIVRAAETAYRSTLPSGARPTLFLDIVVAADAVDVNVHPAKAEVRFRDRWSIERAVEDAVRRALGTLEAGASLGRTMWPAPAFRAPAPAVDREALAPMPADAGPLFDDNAAEPDAAPAPVLVEAEVPPLVQLRRTYLMFEHDQGVVLIDQHSAHERVLFERFMAMLTRGEAPSQRLLFPMTLHLSPTEADAFEEHREMLAQLGFEIEGFGGQSLIVRSVPMPHPRFDAERCLRETLSSLAGDRGAASAARHERLAATVACKAAIKAGESLSAGEMRALFIALRDTTLPAHDVHGRSTIVQLGWDEVERRFGRR